MSKNVYVNHETFIEEGGYFPIVTQFDKSIYVFCRTGAGHLGRYGKIVVLSSQDSATWQKRGIIQEDNCDIRNPSVYIFPNGKMFAAAYKYNVYNKNNIASPSESKSPDNFGILFFVSGDGGETWNRQKDSNIDRITNTIGKVSPHGKMFLYNNKLLLPVYNHNGAFILASPDQGKTWDIFSKIAPNLLEPFVINTSTNKLIAVMRSGRKDNFGESSLVCIFTDNEWSNPMVITGKLQHPANLLLLSDGNILLTYSDRTVENQRILCKVSKDNGKSWSEEIQIGSRFQNCDFGYPSTIGSPDDLLLTVFYANPMQEPYFYFNNKELYDYKSAKGYYYRYSIKDIYSVL